MVSFYMEKQGGNLKIFLVDDDNLSLKILSPMLKKEGFEVESENDPSEAIKKIREKDFDLVVTDICMPRIDGFQIFREVKKKNSRIPVIGISSSFTRTDDVSLADFHAVFLKPLDREKFIKIIKKAAA